MRFTFSEQEEGEPSRDERPDRTEPRDGASASGEAGDDEKVLERLKEDAHVYGWEFDEAREVFHPTPAF